MSDHSVNIKPEIIAEAAEWLVEIQEAPLSAKKQQVFEQWRSQSAAHQLAWQQAIQLQKCLADTPYVIKQQVLDDQGQQKYLSKFLVLVLCCSTLSIAAFYAQQQAIFADYRTAYGEQQKIILEDGTQIILNSKTAIDVQYTTTERNITLRYGEIYITTAKDQTEYHRPFKVLGKYGSIQALGTQFDVEQRKDQTQVAVLEHAVLIKNQHGQQLKLNAGQKIQFNAKQIQMAQSIEPLNYTWRNGLIVADRMSLAQFALAIEKNYGVHVEFSPELEKLIISGTYPTQDLNSLLASLGNAYHLNINHSIFGKKIKLSKID
ncbi:DUF4974 domain-containing protein [Acinetobacter qingfengensis]|uniref:Uncharacterized protein n=1 Tax=Acinetobacter qingfengensis TaxID=1262585 RepID=A0A1E7QWG1_9GAMM|nr:FecR domain-containing protein [Acinetobacter qingfengensis]KAA8731310.1 DUF4974 domain-containing protein [Acinetobacter qingfengensis]OEY91444.1 hypothetical protein BJI46_06820 [Acinetobacter qingfengensis]